MTKASYALQAARDAAYETAEHQWVAMAVARGEIPPEHERTFEQAEAIAAYLDGNFPVKADYYFAKITDCGHGHKEGVAYRRTVDPWRAVCKRLFEPRTARGEGDRDESIARATKRAKTRIRLLCKSLGVNSMGTLTYQENMQDRKRLWRHWKEFLRRVRLVLPDFVYVGAAEKQERGSLHIHFAMRKLPLWFHVVDKSTGNSCPVRSWDYLRRIWRDVIGGGGNFDESAKLNRAAKHVAMQVAFYLSKYVGKEFEHGDLNARRFVASGNTPPANVIKLRYEAAATSIVELIQMLYEYVPDDFVDLSTSLARSKEMFWFSALAGDGTPRHARAWEVQ